MFEEHSDNLAGENLEMGNPWHVVASSLPKLSMVAACDEMQVEGKAVRNQWL